MKNDKLIKWANITGTDTIDSVNDRESLTGEMRRSPPDTKQQLFM